MVVKHNNNGSLNHKALPVAPIKIFNAKKGLIEQFGNEESPESNIGVARKTL